MEREHEGRMPQHRYRGEILDRIVGERPDARRHRVSAGVGEAERVAVGIRVGDLAAADAAAAADAVFDDERLAQALNELLRHQPRDGIGAAAGRERHDEPHWALGPARVDRLRMGDVCRK